MKLADRLENAAEAMGLALDGGHHAFAVVELPVLAYALHIVDTAKRNKTAVKCNGEYKIAKQVFDDFLLGRFYSDNGPSEYYRPQLEKEELSSAKIIFQEALELYNQGVIKVPRSTVF